MCLGGHLAYRCALDSRVKAAVCYFATDIHSKTLARGKNDDSLARSGDIKGELLMVCSVFSLLHRPPPLVDFIIMARCFAMMFFWDLMFSGGNN